MIPALPLRPALRILSTLVWILGPGLSAGPMPLAQPGAQSETLQADDGPHVIWKGSRARIYRIRGGRLETEDATGRFALALPGVAPRPLALGPAELLPAQAVFPAPKKILAVSDVHGHFETLLNLLKAQKVVDDHLRWTFGQGHLVVVGDLMDRGNSVTECLWFFRALEESARKQGGWVHVLPGNHEVMVAAGDLRYLNSKYAGTIQGLPSQPELLGPDSELGRWLRSRPILLKLGNILFVHGGISPELVARGWSLKQINARLQAAWGVPSHTAEGDAAMLLGPMGPIWYRGLLPPGGPPSSSDEEVTQALAHFQATAMVVGHTTLDHVTAFHGGKVFGIDAGILRGRAGEAWFWEGGRAWRVNAAGKRELLTP
ncbi:MAG: metallophosphoesterase [Holophagaceae bacterium]|nr:metallophosphoesterase [Holophagaceae bacterium]